MFGEVRLLFQMVSPDFNGLVMIPSGAPPEFFPNAADVLVVGGGDSAVESALGLANQQGTEVSLSYRGDGFKRTKQGNQTRLARMTAEQRLTLVEVYRLAPGADVLHHHGDQRQDDDAENHHPFAERSE